jgi:hypothetical protein
MEQELVLVLRGTLNDSQRTQSEALLEQVRRVITQNRNKLVYMRRSFPDEIPNRCIAPFLRWPGLVVEHLQ